MKSDDRTELDDDSSFEILSSSDEDENTNSLYISTFQDSSFEMLSSLSAVDPLDDEIETSVLQQDMQSKTNALYYNKDHFAPYLGQQTEVYRHSNLCIDGSNSREGVSTSNSDSYVEEADNSLVLCTSDAALPDGTKAKSLSLCKLLRDSQEESEWDKMLQAIRESGTGNEDRFVFQRIIDPVVKTESETSVPTDEMTVRDSESSVDESHFVEESEKVFDELYPRRMYFHEELCPGLQSGMRLYSWLRSNMYLKKILSGAKSSFGSLIKMFEMAGNHNAAGKIPLMITVIADAVDYMAIVDSFRDTFKGRVLFCRSSNKSNLAQPVLPTSSRSALISAQAKISLARQQRNHEIDSLLISTVTFLSENIPQRWQMSTVLCLDDPRLGLSLHNFTQTMPVPNEFIHTAERFTSKDYPFKDLGYAITLKEAIDYALNCDSGEDSQEFLTGVSRYVTLKSAADVLSGMYNKYTCTAA